MEANKLKLSKYTSKDSLVLSGRERGIAVRGKINLDQYDLDTKSYEVVVPENILSLNSSFFQGLFGESVKKIGADKFLLKYTFQCSAEIRQDVDRGIKDAVNSANPLGD